MDLHLDGLPFRLEVTIGTWELKHGYYTLGSI